MSLSLRKMSGILMEIYCCLPKLYLLLTMPHCCFCFLQASGEGGSDPTQGWLYRALGREPKRNWAKSGKTPRRGWGWSGMKLILSSLGAHRDEKFTLSTLGAHEADFIHPGGSQG